MEQGMKITQVSFRRKFNLGFSETFDLEITATLGEGDDLHEVTKKLDAYTQQYRERRIKEVRP
jgi:hypothetical protein